MNPEHLVTFGSPQWIWSVFLIPLALALFAWAERRRARALQSLVAARLQAELAGNASVLKRRLRFLLALGALGCFIVSLAQPRHGFTIEESKRKGRDVLIAVDTSRSMLSTDVKPNRLARAKFAAQDLINSLQGDRVGLLAFAGSAFLQAPLTVDYTAVLDSLAELDTNIIPLGGTNLAEAIRSTMEAFGKGESDNRILVIFTDGEDLSASALEAAKKAAGAVHIFTVGIGSADGSLIPVPSENGGTEFVKGPDGQFVKSRLDEATLTAIAQATGGFYTHLQNSPVEMRRLIDEGIGKLSESEIDARMARRPIERYQWPLGLGIVLLAASMLINERKSRKFNSRVSVAAGVLLLCALAAPAAHADPGVDLYNQGKYEEAQKAFDATAKRRPGLPELEFNKGAVKFATGDLDAASVAFGNALATRDPQLRGKAEYNLGTTLLKRALGRDEIKQEKEREADLKNAVQHFEEAQKTDSKNPDLRANLDLAKRELAKPKPTPPPQQKQDQQQDQKKDDKDQQKQDQQSKDQQSKDQQSKDQQSKDQQSKDQQSKDQHSKDQHSKDQQSKDQQSKDQQSKDQQSKDQQSENQQGQQGQQQQQPGSTPAPTPGPQTPGEEKKLSGDIKANDASKPEGEAEAAEAPVKPGEMSPAQARAVLDSLKGEDEQPFKIQQRSAAPVLKNW